MTTWWPMSSARRKRDHASNVEEEKKNSSRMDLGLNRGEERCELQMRYEARSDGILEDLSEPNVKGVSIGSTTIEKSCVVFVDKRSKKKKNSCLQVQLEDGSISVYDLEEVIVDVKVGRSHRGWQLVQF